MLVGSALLGGALSAIGCARFGRSAEPEPASIPNAPPEPPTASARSNACPAARPEPGDACALPASEICIYDGAKLVARMPEECVCRRCVCRSGEFRCGRFDNDD